MTGPGYWRAAADKLELLDRHPAAPAPPFRPHLLWIVLWLFVALLGGLLVQLSLNSMVSGKPLKAGDGSGPGQAILPLLLGLSLLVMPFWHVPQVRKEDARLYPRIKAGRTWLEVYGELEEHFLTWESIRGFRVETRRGRDLLVVDLLPAPGAEQDPPGTAGGRSITGLRCIEPHSSAFALNYLLGNPSLRQEPASPRSAAAVNEVLAGFSPSQARGTAPQ